MGGAGSVDFVDYLVAIHLGQLRSWFHQTTDIPWVDLETSLVPRGDPSHSLLLDVWKPWKTHSPTIHSILLAWRMLLANSPVTTHISLLAFPIKLMEFVIPFFNHSTMDRERPYVYLRLI